MSAHTKLLDSVEGFMRTFGVSATRFGRDAMGDPNFVHQLRGGREPRTPVRERVLAYMDHERRNAKKRRAA